MQRLKHNRLAAVNAPKTLRHRVPAVATHDDNGVVQAAADAGPHQAAHGIVLDEVLVVPFEPKSVSEAETL